LAIKLDGPLEQVIKLDRRHPRNKEKKKDGPGNSASRLAGLRNNEQG